MLLRQGGHCSFAYVHSRGLKVGNPLPTSQRPLVDTFPHLEGHFPKLISVLPSRPWALV